MTPLHMGFGFFLVIVVVFGGVGLLRNSKLQNTLAKKEILSPRPLKKISNIHLSILSLKLLLVPH